MSDRYLKIRDDNSRAVERHPGWLVDGETPETSRPMTADELAEHGWYLIVDAGPPEFDPDDERVLVEPITAWQIIDDRAHKAYRVEALPGATHVDVDGYYGIRRAQGAQITIGQTTATIGIESDRDWARFMMLVSTADIMLREGRNSRVFEVRDVNGAAYNLNANVMIDLGLQVYEKIDKLDRAAWLVKEAVDAGTVTRRKQIPAAFTIALGQV